MTHLQKQQQSAQIALEKCENDNVSQVFFMQFPAVYFLIFLHFSFNFFTISFTIFFTLKCCNSNCSRLRTLGGRKCGNVPSSILECQK